MYLSLLGRLWRIEQRACNSDVKFPNEAKAIDAVGGGVVGFQFECTMRNLALSYVERWHFLPTALITASPNARYNSACFFGGGHK